MIDSVESLASTDLSEERPARLITAVGESLPLFMTTPKSVPPAISTQPAFFALNATASAMVVGLKKTRPSCSTRTDSLAAEFNCPNSPAGG